jgi:hypothetical protein
MNYCAEFVETHEMSAAMKCAHDADDVHDAVYRRWEDVLTVALVPIPCGWLLVYTVAWLGRWVRRGFQPKQYHTRKTATDATEEQLP